MKKIILVACMALAATFAWSEGFIKTINGTSDSDEYLRLELNVSDMAYSNIISSGNSTDLCFEISTMGNQLGFLTGIAFRENFVPVTKNSVTNMNFNFVLIPYIGVSAYNNELAFGLIPSLGNLENNFSPYLSYRHLFNFFEMKPGFDWNMGLKLGLEWYVDIMPSDADVGASILAGFFSIIIPKLTLGATFQIGKGWVKTVKTPVTVTPMISVDSASPAELEAPVDVDIAVEVNADVE